MGREDGFAPQFWDTNPDGHQEVVILWIDTVTQIEKVLHMQLTDISRSRMAR